LEQQQVRWVAGEGALASLERERAALEERRGAQHQQQVVLLADREQQLQTQAAELDSRHNQLTHSTRTLDPTLGHLLFVPTGRGYSLIERAGPVPNAGGVLEHPTGGDS